LLFLWEGDRRVVGVDSVLHSLTHTQHTHSLGLSIWGHPPGARKGNQRSPNWGGGGAVRRGGGDAAPSSSTAASSSSGSDSGARVVRRLAAALAAGGGGARTLGCRLGAKERR